MVNSSQVKKEKLIYIDVKHFRHLPITTYPVEIHELSCNKNLQPSLGKESHKHEEILFPKILRDQSDSLLWWNGPNHSVICLVEEIYIPPVYSKVHFGIHLSWFQLINFMPHMQVAIIFSDLLTPYSKIAHSAPDSCIVTIISHFPSVSSFWCHINPYHKLPFWVLIVNIFLPYMVFKY